MKKTQQYNLNLPEAEDYYSIEHHNANMRSLDAALSARVGVGVYVGDDAETREIDLPRAPQFVLLLREGSRLASYNSRYGGLAVEGSPAKAGDRAYLELTERGFRVTHLPSAFDGVGSTADTNSAGIAYHYLWG